MELELISNKSRYVPFRSMIFQMELVPFRSSQKWNAFRNGGTAVPLHTITACSRLDRKYGNVIADKWYSQFSSEWTSCHPSEPSIFSKMVMIWQQSWTAKSDYSRKYSDVILQTLIRDPPKGCKRLQITKAKAKSRFLAFPTVPLLFYPCPHFPPLSHKHKQQQICCLVLLKKNGRDTEILTFLTEN